jgi:hypothetical protein
MSLYINTSACWPPHGIVLPFLVKLDFGMQLWIYITMIPVLCGLWTSRMDQNLEVVFDTWPRWVNPCLFYADQNLGSLILFARTTIYSLRCHYNKAPYNTTENSNNNQTCHVECYHCSVYWNTPRRRCFIQTKHEVIYLTQLNLSRSFFFPKMLKSHKFLQGRFRLCLQVFVTSEKCLAIGLGRLSKKSSFQEAFLVY